jgi:hypothetical protein
VQPRIYALAAQIKWPEAEKIWVEFDQIRHDRIGRVFTRDDSIATWKYLKQEAEKLLAMPDPPPRHVNADCRYCPIKVGCPELTKVLDAGAMLAGMTIEEVAADLGKVQASQKALEQLAKELDAVLVDHAQKSDLINWTDPKTKVKITARASRSIDAERAAKILGPELMKLYGSLTMRSVDKLLKGTELTPAQKRELQDLIYTSWGDMHAKVELKGSIDEIDND